MAWTKFQYTIAVMLVFTGSINTLASKWADRTDSAGRDDVVRRFNHPFVQGCAMFVGELSCLITFKILVCCYKSKEEEIEDDPDVIHRLLKGNRATHPFILLPPALLDMLATSIMYIGLNLTYASSFQMLRGSVIIFTAIFSVIFLKRRISLAESIGILFIIIGLVVVGISDMLSETSNIGETVSQRSLIIGDLLIILAQIFQSMQMVYEERFVARLEIPALQAVGWEGIFGLCVLTILLVPMYFIKVMEPYGVGPDGNLEDAVDAMVQIKNSWELIVSFLSTIISIAFFNFAGISITKEISATTRMVLDSIRTFVVWQGSIALGWQHFHVLQAVGFISLLFGMYLYHKYLVIL